MIGKLYHIIIILVKTKNVNLSQKVFHLSICIVYIYFILLRILEESKFENIYFSFHDKIKAGIYEDLYIEFKEFE